MLARALDAIPKAYEIIPIANEHRAHSAFSVDPVGKLAGNGQNHLLFARTPLSYRPRIFAPVTGIDGDHDVP